MIKKIAVTGANGFIGEKLSSHFLKNGFSVRALVRQPSVWKLTPDSFTFDLSKSVSPEALRGVDVLIHCAHSNDASMISGTHALIMAAREARVKQFVFISSMSSGQNSLSEYGRLKFAVESLLDPTRDLILRPGLVIGNGGLFGRMMGFIKKSPVVPLIGGGIQPIETVYVDDLVNAATELVAFNQTGLLQISAQPELTLRDLNLAIAEQLGKRRRFVNLPMGFAEKAAAISDYLKIPLPVNKENVLGLKQLGKIAKAPQANLSFKLRDYKESLRDLFRNTTT